MARFSKSIKYLSAAEIIAVNEEMVSSYGGLYGVRDLNLLKSAVSRPQTSINFQDPYKTIFDKAAAMFHSIINNHPFLDGNKRTALFAAVLFLEYNGWSVKLKRKETAKFALKAHNDRWSIEQISNWLKEHSLRLRR